MVSAVSEVESACGSNRPLTKTTMSNPSLPPEMLDHTVVFLHDDVEALRECCLVSKSWVPRARRHLFAVVQFRTPDDIDTWKKTFPDPSNSPAHYTHTLSINCFEVITVADGVEGGWIPTFTCVVCLELDNSLASLIDLLQVSLAPFCQFSATLKVLRVVSFFLPHSRVFNLIRSLPLLEDLIMMGNDPVTDDNKQDGPHIVVSSPSSPSSPRFTGTLELYLLEGAAGIVRPLLNLPNGIHFRSVKLSWYKGEYTHYMTELVVACSDTLENLRILYPQDGAVHSVFFLTQSLTRPLSCRRIYTRCDRPLYSDETQEHRVRMRNSTKRMGHHDAQHHYI